MTVWERIVQDSTSLEHTGKDPTEQLIPAKYPVHAHRMRCWLCVGVQCQLFIVQGKEMGQKINTHQLKNLLHGCHVGAQLISKQQGHEFRSPFIFCIQVVSCTAKNFSAFTQPFAMSMKGPEPLLFLQSPPQSMACPPPATTCYAEQHIRGRQQNYLSLALDIFFPAGTFDLALHPSSDLALASF